MSGSGLLNPKPRKSTSFEAPSDPPDIMRAVGQRPHTGSEHRHVHKRMEIDRNCHAGGAPGTIQGVVGDGS